MPSPCYCEAAKLTLNGPPNAGGFDHGEEKTESEDCAQRARGRLPLRRFDADRQPRGYFAARAARAERSGRDRLRGHAADHEASLALRHSQAHGQLPRAQRNHARARDRDRAGAGRQSGAGQRCGHAGHLRSRLSARQPVPAARNSGGSGAGSVGAGGGALGFRHAHRGVRVRGVLAVAADRAAQGAARAGGGAAHARASTRRRTGCSTRSRTRSKFSAIARR